MKTKNLLLFIIPITIMNNLKIKSQNAFIIMSIVILLPLLSKSQNFYTLPDSNAMWVIEIGHPFPVPTDYNRYFISKNKNDTTINSKKYIKVFNDAIMNGQYFSPSYYGAYRSLSTGQTYFVMKDSINEYLLFDFSKLPGDTIRNVLVSSPISGILDCVVDSVMNVPLGPYQLKTLYVHTIPSATMPGSLPLIWVEKIGCLGGGLENIVCFIPFPPLNCMSVNDTIYYYGNGQPDCYFSSSYFNSSMVQYFFPYSYSNGGCFMPLNVPEIKGHKVYIYPNPFTNQLFIENLSEDAFHIKIIDVLGQIIYSTFFQNSKSNVLLLEHIPAGIYFLNIQNNSGETIIKKIIKQ